MSKPLMLRRRSESMRATDAEVAISCASADSAFAEEIADVLRRRGVRTYFYVESPEVTLGADLDATLRRIYGHAPIVIVLLSRHFETPFTAIEVEAALGGAAANEGLIPIPLDDSPLPASLTGRTRWPAEKGVHNLAAAILRKLGRPVIRPAVLGLLLLGLTTVAGVYVVWGLGFRVPTRWPDGVLWLAACSPALWFGIFGVSPLLGAELRRRRGPAAALLRTTIERRVDWWARYAAGVFGVALVVAMAWGFATRKALVDDHRAALSALTALESDYRSYHDALGRVTSLAAQMVAAAPDPTDGRRSDLAARYDAARAEVESLGGGIRRGLSSAAASRSAATSTALVERMQALERNIQSNLGYQVRRLSEPAPPGVSSSEMLTRRMRLADTLASWNRLFTQQLFDSEAAFVTLQRDVSQRLAAEALDWRGILGP